MLAQGTSIGLILAGFLIPAGHVAMGLARQFRGSGGHRLCLGGVVGRLRQRKEKSKTRSVDHAAATASPVTYWRLLLDRSVLGCIITHFVGYWSLALALTWLPAYFQRGLGYDGIGSGRIYAFVIALTIPLGLGLAWWSQFLLKKGVSSKAARGRYLSCFLMLAGILFAAVYAERGARTGSRSVFWHWHRAHADHLFARAGYSGRGGAATAARRDACDQQLDRRDGGNRRAYGDRSDHSGHSRCCRIRNRLALCGAIMVFGGFLGLLADRSARSV